MEKSKSRLFHLAWKSRKKRGIPTFHTASTAAGYSLLGGLMAPTPTGGIGSLSRRRLHWIVYQPYCCCNHVFATVIYAAVTNSPACPCPTIAYKTPSLIPSTSAASRKPCWKTSTTVSSNPPGRRAHKDHAVTTDVGCPAARDSAGWVSCNHRTRGI